MKSKHATRAIVTNSPAETVSAGRAFAKKLSVGMVIGIVGPYGAGKTCFIKGLAAGLGVPSPGRSVTSPSFVMMNVHKGRKLYLGHIDAYRLNRSADFYALGAEDVLDEGIIVVEWADRVNFRTPPHAMVYIVHNGKTKRNITIEWKQ